MANDMMTKSASSSHSLYDLQSYCYELPPELIASYPVTPRDHSRLMVVERGSGTITEAHVYDLPDILSPEDALIFNNTRVVHAVLDGTLEGGKKFECLLTKKLHTYDWLVLAKPARLLKEGTHLLFTCGIEARVIQVQKSGERVLRFSQDLSYHDLQKLGSVPLPPYMKRKADRLIDTERYQTIYATELGSVAAPTAGLHFTEELFDRLSKKGISRHFVTLHVGTGTFVPIRNEDIREHSMHEESYELSQDVVAELKAVPKLSRRIAVGTTSCRVLETVVRERGEMYPGKGSTRLFVYPGYQFQYVNGLFTNFHTPGSSLLTLVAAFMGYELMREAYARAIEKKYRFFSYGDAMLIL